MKKEIIILRKDILYILKHKGSIRTVLIKVDEYDDICVSTKRLK